MGAPTWEPFQLGLPCGFPGYFDLGLDENMGAPGSPCGFPGFFHLGLDDNERERERERGLAALLLAAEPRPAAV